MLFRHFLLPARTCSVAFLALWGVVWARLLTRTVLEIFRRLYWLRIVIVTGALATCTLAASLLVEVIEGVRPPGVITAASVVARQGDGHAYEPIFGSELNGGTEFRLLEDRGVWWHIRLVDGRETWIASRAAELV